MPTQALPRESPELRLIAPARIHAGEPLKLTFEVSNNGADGFYFKVPWKWATNGMRVVAIGSEGREYASGTALYDIAAESACTHFKALGSHERLQFERTLPDSGIGPTLQLPPGSYQLKWIYDVVHYEDEKTCAAGGWPIWGGKAESSPVTLEVMQP